MQSGVRAERLEPKQLGCERAIQAYDQPGVHQVSALTLMALVQGIPCHPIATTTVKAPGTEQVVASIG